MIRRIRLVVLCAVVFSGCLRVSTPLSGGSASEGEARVCGSVVYAEDGRPATHALVRLRPALFLKASSLSDSVSGVTGDCYTDEDGVYIFDVVDTGSYCIEVNDGASQGALRRCHVASDVILPVDTLKPNGEITGKLEAFLSTPVTGEVQVYGLDHSASIDPQQKTYRLTDVPAGDYALRLVISAPDCPPQMDDSVTILAGQTTAHTFSFWNYSQRLVLNTTASGADVSGTVYNFPVLIRLTESNFDFTETHQNGVDIRFKKSDTVYLPHEIERWDPSAGFAEVWVNIDTIRGNDSTQSITMYWGNPDASDASNGAAVFDTGSGFQGIWHLGETDTTAFDATGNRYNGTGYFTSMVSGIIGGAQHFNGASSYIRMKGSAPQSRLNFPMNGRYTLSAWVYHDTLADSVTYLIAGKGELQYFMKSFDLALSTTQHEHQWEFTEYHEGNAWQAAVFVPATAGSWQYLVGVREGSNEYLYVNGVPTMKGYDIFGTQQGVLPRDTTDDFTIGGFLRPVTDWKQGYAYFNGAIDEVNVASMPRSADWIKLCYMNQKEQDALVKW